MAFQINGEKGRSIVSISGRPSLFFSAQGFSFSFSSPWSKCFFWPYPIQPISQNALVHWSPLPVKFFSIWGNQLARPRAHAFLPAVSTVCHGSVYKRFSPASPADTVMRTGWSNRKISFCSTGHATSLVGRCAWNGSSGAVPFRLQSKPLVNRWYAQTRKGLITGFAP